MLALPAPRPHGIEVTQVHVEHRGFSELLTHGVLARAAQRVSAPKNWRLVQRY